MTPDQSPGGGGILRALALVALVAGAMIAIGYAPTKRVGGPEAVSAMLAGCAVSVIGSVAGMVPLAVAWRASMRRTVRAVLMAMVFRFVVVLGLALSLGLSGWFARAPLLVWVAISYVVLLVVDTIHAVRFSGAAQTPEK